MIKQSKVNFFFSESKPNLENRSVLKKFIISLFKTEKTRLESITYIFSNDSVLYELNKKYLQHDFYTDIITFDLSIQGQPKVAEVYISTDRVKENSLTHKVSFKSELHRVIFHGALHLCGYNDKSLKQTKQMRTRENYYLLQYFSKRFT
jgi:probable rRNA maturation factor